MTLDQLVGNMIDAGASREAIMAVIRAGMPQLTAKQLQNKRAYAKRKATETTEIQQVSVGTENTEIQQVSTEIQPPSRVVTKPSKKEITEQKEERKKDVREELLAVLDEEHADALIEHRKGLRAALTPHAARLIAKKLDTCPVSANDAVDEMIANGWRGIKPDWLRTDNQRRTRIEDDLDFISKNFSHGEAPNGREISRNALGNVESVPAKPRREHQGVVVDLPPNARRTGH